MEFRVDAGRVFGAAQETQDGALRCYMRLAVANQPYTYNDGIGGRRQEIIPESELFNADSAESFKMVPITLRHPQERIVNSSNANGLMRGMTGHFWMREDTADGSFLGLVATVADKEAVDAIKNGWQISPGYRVRTKVREDGIFEQFNRRGNHVAIVERARGGAHVKPLLDGLNIDAADEIWHVDTTEDSPIFTAKLNRDLVVPALENLSLDGTGLKRRESIDLDRYKFSTPEAPEEATAEEEEEQPKRRKRKKPQGFGSKSNQDACSECGADCDCEDCSQKRKGKTKRKKQKMTSISVDGVTYNDVDSALAQAVAPHLERSDSLDDVLALNEELSEALESLTAERDELSANNDSLTEELAKANERADSVQLDSEDAEVALQINIDAVQAVSTLREDAQLVIDSGVELGEDEREVLSNLDAETILTNLDDLQQVMVNIVNPAMGEMLEHMDGDGVSAAYDASMAMFRNSAQEAQERADSEDVNNDMGYGHGGVYGLAKMPRGGRYKGKGKGDVRKALKQWRSQQSEAFENAGKALGKSGGNDLMIL